jgi:hypothetical protein
LKYRPYPFAEGGVRSHLKQSVCPLVDVSRVYVVNRRFPVKEREGFIIKSDEIIKQQRYFFLLKMYYKFINKEHHILKVSALATIIYLKYNMLTYYNPTIQT